MRRYGKLCVRPGGLHGKRWIAEQPNSIYVLEGQIGFRDMVLKLSAMPT